MLPSFHEKSSMWALVQRCHSLKGEIISFILWRGEYFSFLAGGIPLWETQHFNHVFCGKLSILGLFLIVYNQVSVFVGNSAFRFMCVGNSAFPNVCLKSGRVVGNSAFQFMCGKLSILVHVWETQHPKMSVLKLSVCCGKLSIPVHVWETQHSGPCVGNSAFWSMCGKLSIQ